MNELIKSMREQVLKLESEIGKLPLVETRTEHYFGRKSYVRHLFLPEGTVATGKIHKYPQVNVILKGTVYVLTEAGVKEFIAPCVFESPAGVKRATYAHTDAEWLTIHGTENTDLDALEEELIATSFEEFDKLCLEEA